MPYKVKGKCVYKKDTGAKVGCTKGSVKKYLAALHANANESINEAIDDSTVINFIKALEDSKIIAAGSHNKQNVIDTISSIVSMDEKDFIDYITNNPSKNVRMIRTEFNDWIKTHDLKESKNTLKGGRADDMTSKDIAKKFDMSLDKINSQIDKGIEIEMEHTKDKEKAKEIAMDHISEIPDYYDRLIKMEKSAKKDFNDVNESTKNIIKKLLSEALNKK